LGGIAGLAFLARGDAYGFQRLIQDHRFTRHSVEFVKQGPPPGRVRLADGNEFDDEDLARIDFNLDFLTDLQAVEKRGCGQSAQVVKAVAEGGEVGENLGIHQV
jgi:hypothetical protein